MVVVRVALTRDSKDAAVTTLQPAPAHLFDLVERLFDGYGHRATRDDVTLCVASAWAGVQYVGADNDDEIDRLVSRIAERDLRLRLGLDREAARLDPESHLR